MKIQGLNQSDISDCFLGVIRMVFNYMEAINIRPARKSDIKDILETFAVWHKTKEQFANYLAKQDLGESILIIAITTKNKVVGYANLFWRSRISQHHKQGIPEIVDLNVIPEYQRKGIASQLVHYIEQVVLEKSSSSIGIAVEPTNEYFPAKQLYKKLGYMEEGNSFLDDGTKILVFKKEYITAK